MPETTPLIKAALNLRVGAGFDVYVQEEAVSLKKNLFVVRDFTERTEISSLPNCKLVSCDELYSNIIDFFKKEHQSFDYINPYGDGNASERIIEILSNHI